MINPAEAASRRACEGGVAGNSRERRRNAATTRSRAVARRGRLSCRGCGGERWTADTDRDLVGDGGPDGHTAGGGRDADELRGRLGIELAARNRNGDVLGSDRKGRQ